MGGQLRNSLTFAFGNWSSVLALGDLAAPEQEWDVVRFVVVVCGGVWRGVEVREGEIEE